MTIADVARSEGITTRQAQRYCRAPGYKGHVLKAQRLPKGFVIEVEDYRAWRIECGFDFLPQAAPAVVEVAPATAPAPAVVEVAPAPATAPSPGEVSLTFAELQRRYFSPDKIGGPPTNTFAVGSGTMCSPATQKAYMEACAERMKLRGYEDDEDE